MARRPYIRHVRVGRSKPNPFGPAGGVYDDNRPQFGGGYSRLFNQKPGEEPDDDEDEITEDTTKSRKPRPFKPKDISQVPWTFSPQSSWVHSYRYHYKSATLQIRFKNRKGTITVNCQYTNINRNLGFSIYRAGSKGKWVWRNVYYRPYTKQPI